MKFSVDREDFLEALKRAKNATESKSALPVLNNFLLVAEGGRLIIKATDLENFLTFSVKADVEEEGVLAVNANKLTNVVKSLYYATVVATSQEEKLSLIGGRSKFSLTAINPEDFPEFPEVKTDTSMFARDFLKAIDKVEYAISKEDTRYALQGMYVREYENQTHFVGSDGHRLALYFIDKAIPIDVLIPRKSLKVIEGLIKDYIGDLEIGKDESFAHIKGEDWTLSIRLLEGEYPDYISIIPENWNYEVIADKDELLEALKRLSAIADGKAFPVKVSFQDNLAVLEVLDPEYEGRDEVSVEYTQTPISIGFNGKYLIEALESFDVKKVLIKILDEDSAVLIDSEDKERDPYMCLIMPMRI